MQIVFHYFARFFRTNCLFLFLINGIIQSINTYPYDTGALDGLNTLTSMSSREWPTADISQVALTLADVCLTASPTIVAVFRPSIFSYEAHKFHINSLDFSQHFTQNIFGFSFLNQHL